jgi:hypothetical protein
MARRYEFILRRATAATEGVPGAGTMSGRRRADLQTRSNQPELDENHDPAVKILDEFGARKHPNP